MIFYKLGKIFTTNHKFYYFFSHSHKILCFFDSNTILKSFMTSRIVTVKFLSLIIFFHMIFTSDNCIHGGECHRPWHCGGKHILLKCCNSLNCQLLMWDSTWSQNRIFVDARSKYVIRHATYHSDIPTWVSHHLSLVGYLDIKLPP